MSRPFGQTHRTRGLAAYRPGVDACQRLLLPQVAVAYFFHVYGYRPFFVLCGLLMTTVPHVSPRGARLSSP
jgi:hypothetical protein